MNWHFFMEIFVVSGTLKWLMIVLTEVKVFTEHVHILKIHVEFSLKFILLHERMQFF